VKLLVAAVRDCLTDGLLLPGFNGHCYVASEALYHMLGGKDAGFKPMNLKHEGAQHWWLVGPDGEVIDATADQFKTPVPYDQGRGRGFLTKQPSKRAQKLIDATMTHMVRVGTEFAVEEALEELAYQEKYGGMFVGLDGRPLDGPPGPLMHNPDYLTIKPIPVGGYEAPAAPQPHAGRAERTSGPSGLSCW